MFILFSVQVIHVMHIISCFLSVFKWYCFKFYFPIVHYQYRHTICLCILTCSRLRGCYVQLLILIAFWQIRQDFLSTQSRSLTKNNFTSFQILISFISFCCLTALNTMLNASSENGYLCLVRQKSIHSYNIKQDVSCKFFIDSPLSGCSLFTKSLHHKLAMNL